MSSVKKIGIFIDRWYLACMGLVAPLVIYFNWYALHNVFGLEYYGHYRDIIKNGFVDTDLITFPMWGYGWLMLITSDKLGLMIVQFIIAFISLYYFMQLLEKERIFSSYLIRALKIGMVFSLPWYVAHALRWPYSIAISLIPVSILLLHKAFHHPQHATWRWLVGSAVLFGIVLHFRSDYWLMPLGLSFLLIILYRTKRSCIQAIIWLGIIYGSLIPWMLYTKKACGHALLTSTNGGHVAFIGLGNDPQNRWGIQAMDADPVMHRLVDQHFGITNRSTLDYEADQFLKKTFFAYITEYPWDYIKKSVPAFKMLLTEGFYPGEFFMDDQGEVSLGKDIRVRYLFIKALLQPSFLIQNFLPLIKIFLHTLSWFMGRYIVFLSYLLLPIVIGVALLKTHSTFVLLMGAVMSYQTMINVLCSHMVCYTSTLYIFYLLSMLYGASLVYGFVKSWCYSGKYRLPIKA